MSASALSSVDECGCLSLLRHVTMDLGAEDVVVTCGSGSVEKESASPRCGLTCLATSRALAMKIRGWHG